MEDADELGVELNMDILDENPEALFDFLTIKSLQSRHSTTAPPRKPVVRKPIENEAVYQNEAEFETYVQQFPIDDSIAECFALSSEVETSQQQTKFVSGGKRPQVSSKYNKLKKKFGWKQQTMDENLPAEEDFLSRDSKRSKKGGVFSKRHKWRGLGSSKKAVLFSDQSPSPNTDDVKEDDISPRASDLSPNGSNSVSDSQITSFSETLTSDDQTVPLMRGDNSHGRQDFLHSGMLGVVNYGADVLDGDLDFLSIFTGDTTTIIQNLEDLHPEEAANSHDSHGNTLLHHAVTIDNADAVKFILEKYPDMTSDMNNDNITAVEVATKLGKYDCLRVILERNQRRKSLGPSLINRLLNISAQNGQGDCLNLLLTYLSRDPQTISALPGDNRGNTAAHLAAKNGHLHCLQILMAAGYDVTSENLIRQRPLHIAHQNRNETCFSYLLLLDVCEELLRITKTQTHPLNSHSDVTSGLQSKLEQINAALNRYNTLLSNSRQSLDESRSSILQTLNNLQNDLDLFIKHTDCDTAYKRKAARQKLDELRGEIEQLEDTFEFSPIVEMEATITRLLGDIGDTLTPLLDRIHGGDGGSPSNLEMSMSEDEVGHILSSLIKDIYKEFMLENWNVGHIFERYLGALRSSKNGNGAIHNTSSELDTSGERKTMMIPNRNIFPNSNVHLNISVEDQACQTDFEENTCKQCGTLHHPKQTHKHSEIDIDIESEVEAARKVMEATGAKTELSKESEHSELNSEECVANLHNNDILDTPIDATTRSGKTDSFPPTERPFAKLLSLDERMELLISGERAKLKLSDSSDTLVYKSESPEAQESMTTTSFTSITSDSTSGITDWYSKLGFSSLDTSPDDVTNEITSETPSYWWDVGDNRERAESSIYRKPDSFRGNIRRQIHLNLENDDSTLEELRQHRLLNHLHSVQQTRYPSGNYTEKITTASGEVIGGFPSRDPIGIFSPRDTSETRDSLSRGNREVNGGADNLIGGFKSRGASKAKKELASRDETTKIVVDVNGALQRRNESNAEISRNSDHQELFTLEDAINSNQSRKEEYYGRYNVRSRDVYEAPSVGQWEDTSYTDDDDSISIPWYEIEDLGQSIRWNKDTDMSDGTTTPQSYV